MLYLNNSNVLPYTRTHMTTYDYDYLITVANYKERPEISMHAIVKPSFLVLEEAGAKKLNP